MRIGSVIFATNYDLTRAVVFYVFSSAIFYLVCNLVFLKTSGMKVLDALGLLKGAIPILLGWSALGIAVICVLGVIS